MKVEVRNDKLVVENIRSGTCAAPNAAVELGQESWCGPNSGATAAQPVGSTVDKVVINPYRGNGYDTRADVPTPAAAEADWLQQTTEGATGTLTLTALS